MSRGARVAKRSSGGQPQAAGLAEPRNQAGRLPWGARELRGTGPRDPRGRCLLRGAAAWSACGTSRPGPRLGEASAPVQSAFWAVTLPRPRAELVRSQETLGLCFEPEPGLDSGADDRPGASRVGPRSVEAITGPVHGRRAGRGLAGLLSPESAARRTLSACPGLPGAVLPDSAPCPSSPLRLRPLLVSSPRVFLFTERAQDLREEGSGGGLGLAASVIDTAPAPQGLP